MRGVAWLPCLAVLAMFAGCGDDKTPSGGVDEVPPEVTLLAPADSVEIEAPRSIQFRARATDNVGVRVAIFYFDGEQVGEATESTENVFSFLWPTEPLAASAHRAIVRAFDWANLVAADTATVIVQ